MKLAETSSATNDDGDSLANSPDQHRLDVLRRSGRLDEERLAACRRRALAVPR